jgi:hypothetical protein
VIAAINSATGGLGCADVMILVMLISILMGIFGSLVLYFIWVARKKGGSR